MSSPSLRKRFIFIAIASTLSLILLSISAKFYFSADSEQRLSSSKQRLYAATDLNEISRKITSSYKTLNLFLFSPHESHASSFSTLLHEVNQLLLNLKENSWLVKSSEKNLIAIQNVLISLEVEAEKLFLIRSDVFKMYPGLSSASDYQLQSYSEVVNLIGVSLNELGADGEAGNRLYLDLLEYKDYWRRLVNLHRIYALNLTADIDSNNAVIQEKNIEEMLALMKTFMSQNFDYILQGNYYDGLETEDAIKQFPAMMEKWSKGFYLMKKYSRKEEWRADVPVLLNSIDPKYESINMEIEYIHKALSLSAAKDLKEQNFSYNIISELTWFLIVLFIGSLTLIYFLMNRTLINPISSMAKSIRDNNLVSWSPGKNYIKSSEVDEFASAYTDMQSQVIARQNQLEHLALHDSLTNLPNRILILDRISQSIKNSKRYVQQCVLVLLDLDRFKEINDTLGHLVGDKILCIVAERLTQCLRKTDTVARLGGDEFAILLTNADSDLVEELVMKFVESLHNVFHVDEHSLYIGSSLGVAIYPHHGNSPEELLKHADVAMYVAKNSNVDYSIYNHKDDIYNLKKLDLLTEIKFALDDKQLYLKYQPIYSLVGSEIIGFECLLRWNHPIYGEVMPDDFIPNAEQTGLIKRITERVINMALENVSVLREYVEKAYVSVNVTAWDLQDENFINIVNNGLKKNKLSADAILFELTERSMMNDSSRVQSTLKILSDSGIKFAIDDFGTGFSSMSYLKQLPVNTLKIDKSFISGMLNNIDDKLIVHSIIGLAHNLGLSIIAEGVEDKETITILEALECDAIQGYYYSKPLVLEDIISNLTNDKIYYLNRPK